MTKIALMALSPVQIRELRVAVEDRVFKLTHAWFPEGAEKSGPIATLQAALHAIALAESETYRAAH